MLKQFSCGQNVLKESKFVTQLSSNAGISADKLCGLRKVVGLRVLGVSEGLVGTRTCMAVNPNLIFNITL
jgi:hypothetical protein